MRLSFSFKRKERKRVIIMGAAGRDFHNFNVYFRKNPYYNVVCFTATQIPGIANRNYPPSLAGKFYPKGIPILPEKDLPQLIKEFKASKIMFAYSDVSHLYVMHKASLALATGASFVLLGPQDTMLKSKKPVIAVCAVRTGAGKSQTTRRVAELLREAGKKVAVVRHPMPYGRLEKQACQRFASFKDLDLHNCTVEEREEYEPLINEGFIVFAGVDYEQILRKAEKEVDVVIWDGGNNDMAFFKPDLMITVTDPFRAGHEIRYHPGEANFRMADVIVINKLNTAHPKQVAKIEKNAKLVNAKAVIVKAASEMQAEGIESEKGKKVLCIEDGPSVTHGDLPFGVATLMAKRFKCTRVSPERKAVGSLKQLFKKFKHLRNLLPAMGYSKQQLKELEQTINATKCDFVLSGTPIDLRRLIKVNKPLLHVTYKLAEKGTPTLDEVLKKHKFI